MNKFILYLLLMTDLGCQAQQPGSAAGNNSDSIEAFNGEFNVYQNGLIYSPHTVQQLTHIVDSLNLRFKRCDRSRPYMSLRQGIGFHVQIDAKKAKAAAKAMAAGASLQDIIANYATGKKVDSMHITISKYFYDKETAYEITGLTLKNYSDIEITKKGVVDYTRIPLAGKWITADATGEYEMDAIYFINEPKASAIPEKYASMILYSECVIDTTTDIYTGPEDVPYFGRNNAQSEKEYKKTAQFAFTGYLQKSTEHITRKSLPKTYKNQWEYNAIDSMRKAYVKKVLSKQPEFGIKVKALADEFYAGKTYTDDDVEYYVANYYSKKTALEMKRKRRVMGSCSMDQSPRIHAQQIAMLSAEAVNWETFLRAHLNIMNDRFDRASDGSWAQASRQTYIKELETLNLDVNDLLIGISLRTSSAADKHYYGSISRLGRAFAESSNKTLLVNTLLDAIADEQLDVYNRLLMFYLLSNYTYSLQKEEDYKPAFETLLKAKATLPLYVGNKIELKERNTE